MSGVDWSGVAWSSSRIASSPSCGGGGRGDGWGEGGEDMAVEVWVCATFGWGLVVVTREEEVVHYKIVLRDGDGRDSFVEMGWRCICR